MLTHDYAEVNGVRLHYAAAGQGKLMLFVHGFPEFWYEWRNQLEEFGRDHFAVALDMRGYNLSSKPQDVKQYRVRYLSDDLRLLAEHLGYQRFILVAHDWGGAVAWSLAATRPECVEKLIIINSPHPGTFLRELTHSPAQQQASSYMNFFRTGKAERVLEENNFKRLANMIFGSDEPGPFSEDDRRAYLAAWAQPGALTGGLNYYRASPLHPPTPDDPGPQSVQLDAKAITVSVPTLVIWGEKDTALLPGNLDGLEEWVTDLTLKRVPDGSHWIVHEQPELVNRCIREFIAA